MPVVKGKHYPYTAAGKSAAASARKGMKRGGKPRRSDPERRESVRKRAAAARRKDLLEDLAEGGITFEEVLGEYAGPAGRLPPHGALKYSKGGAVNLNRTIRGPNS